MFNRYFFKFFQCLSFGFLQIFFARPHEKWSRPFFISGKNSQEKIRAEKLVDLDNSRAA
jgi:hypothetical protein